MRKTLARENFTSARCRRAISLSMLKVPNTKTCRLFGPWTGREKFGITWCSQRERELSNWASAGKTVLLIQPPSAAFQRFSLPEYSFRNSQAIATLFYLSRMKHNCEAFLNVIDFLSIE